MKKTSILGILILAMVIQSQAQVGHVGINTTTPAAMLHVKDSSVVFTGPSILPSTPGSPPVSGTGIRMMWYSDKAAFRVGSASGATWNKDSIGIYSMAFGFNPKAKGSYAMATGILTIANDYASTAMGSETEATNYYATSMGIGTKAMGSASTAMGYGSIAKPYCSMAIGRYNDTTTISSNLWKLNDPLFIIGNGTSSNARSNAITVLKSGRTGINTSSPLAMFHVKDSSVVFTGTYPLPGSPDGPPVSGSGVRMMWYPDKAAFRTGYAGGTAWNKDSIGYYSMAFGFSPKAKADYSAAMGYESIASGSSAVAMGFESIASGSSAVAMGFESIASATSATAMGYQTIASGLKSTAMGEATIAKGISSTTMGYKTMAKSYLSLAVGRYNDTTAISSSGWFATDPLFIIGNGSADNARSNALTVMKNGNVSIGPDYSPDNRLLVSSNHAGDGGWNEGIMVESTNVTTGEAAVGYKNTATPGSRHWLIGLNQNPILAFNYGINFATANTKMAIDTFGNVGIGVTSPSYLLEVDGTAGKPGGGSWTNSSDLRLKKDIQPFTDGLSSLLRINPVTYHYNELSGYNTKPEYVGVIAQELNEVAPYMVSVSNKKTDDGVDDYLQVDNSAMTYMLINAVKEQQKVIQELKKRIEILEAK